MKKRTRPLPALLLAALLSVGVSSASEAQGPQLSAPTGNDPGDEAFRDGNTLYRQQRWAEAKAAFERAFNLKKAHDIAANLAYTEIELGLHPEAAEHLSYAVKNWAPTGRKDTRQSAIEWLEKEKRLVGTLLISVNVAGASVAIDGKVIGRAPLEGEVFVAPGKHAVQVRLGGFVPKEVSVEIAKGASQEVGITLEKAVEDAPPVPTASATGMASVGPPPLPPPPAGGANRTLLITGGVAAGAALGMGVVFALLSGGKASDVKQQQAALLASHGPRSCTGANVPEGCATLQDTIKTHNTFSNLEGWSFVAAGALGAGTIVYWLVAPKAAQQATVVAVPTVTARGGGFSVGGVW